MSYYPHPNQRPNYSMAYYSNPSQAYASEQLQLSGAFPVDNFGPPGEYAFTVPGQFFAPGPPYDQGYGQAGFAGGIILSQPIAPIPGDWMAIPQGIPNCPPGLEFLISLSSLFVKQKVEFLEALTGFETNNKFTIKNDRGEKMYWAVEDSDICSRMCCGQLRPFEMRVFDAQKREVIHLHRKLACAVCCFPCCLQEMEVFAPPGNLLGTIKQNWSICSPQFSIKDASGTTVLKIEGPFCALPICGQAEFSVLSRDGQVKVGKISKEWSGFARELFTDADYFGISFPVDLDVRMKAVMLGAVFLILCRLRHDFHEEGIDILQPLPGDQLYFLYNFCISYAPACSS